MLAVLVDAYDSFVYIIHQYLQMLGVDSRVYRNDALTQRQLDALRPDFLVLGPGPGHPRDARYLPLIQANRGRVPILGVCLGHQAIGLACGATVTRATPRHGKTSPIWHDGTGCFEGRPQPLRVTRYHSLVVAEEGLPDELVVTARALDDGCVMGLRHRREPIESVQFHPESVTTQEGMTLFANFIDTTVRQVREAA